MDPRARLIGLVLALGGLMVTVDTTVALVAVPAIVADLDSTLPVVQWVPPGYLLGVVAVTPLAGWAANRFGARRVYLTALATFTVASALAGLAWDAGSLAACRVLQGLAGWLVDAASWRWVFLINVPIGIAALLLCRRLLPHQPAERAGVPSLDRLGPAQLSRGAALLVLRCTLLCDSRSLTSPVAGALGS